MENKYILQISPRGLKKDKTCWTVMSSSDVVKALMAFTWNHFSFGIIFLLELFFVAETRRKNTYFHICQERNKQNTAADQSGAIRAGVGLGQGRQGRDQGPCSHPWGERWMAANTFHKLDKYI